MIVLWVTLLVLHKGHSLVPVITVQLNEPVTFACVLPNKDFSSRKIHWYKQGPGDNLKLIVSQWKSAPEYAPESESRLELKSSRNFSNLTILRATGEDEGMYHCSVTEWINPEWSGTYLLVKGNTQRTSNYTVVQTVSDPVRPGDSVTLQCSVHSDSENKTCPGDHSVYWFRAELDKSLSNIIYADGYNHNKCEKGNNTQKSCVHRFSKNVSSSDVGTYYCAVATCGEILFGNGTKLENVQTTDLLFTAVVILAVCLAISVVGNVVLIYKQRMQVKSKGRESNISEARYNHNIHQPVDEITEDEKLNYAALNFSERKTRGQKKRDFSEDSVYSQVKC